MLLNKNHLKIMAIFTIYFLFSLLVSEHYTGGDQVYYRAYYDEIRNYNLVDGYVFYHGRIGGSEPVYFLITWLMSRYVDKTIFMSLVNASLATCVFLYLRRIGIGLFVMSLLGLNFYLLVFMFSAERLKFGFLFFTISLLVSTQIKRISFLILSVLSHFQMLILLFALIFQRAMDSFKRSIYRFQSQTKIYFSLKKFLFSTIPFGLLSAAALLFFLQFFLPAIVQKFSTYFLQEGPAGILKPAIFVILSFIYARNKHFESITLNLPILLAAFFLGSERVTLLCYFIFLYYALTVKKGLNAGVIATSLYFFTKGIFFLWNIYAYNDGFQITEQGNLF